MTRLQYIARTDLGEVIEAVQINENLNKSESLKYLIDLARDNSEYEAREFDGDKNVNCTLEISDAEYDTYKDYRRKHKLTKKNKFFRDALKRGASYYLDHQ